MFRAVEQFESILMDAAGLVRPGGCLAVMVGRNQLDIARRALAGTAVERSDRPSTVIQSIPDHRKERTRVVTATYICGTIM